MTNDLPPEAFTRETLQDAFYWLQKQGEDLRASIHTPQKLVSLYQKSKRLQDQGSPEASKKFVHELKNLTARQSSMKNQTPPENPTDNSACSTTTNKPLGIFLDSLSQKRVNKVKQRFNLESDSEALRILISLGFEKFSQFQ